ALPLHDLKVVNHKDVVVALPTHDVVFVTAVTTEVEGGAVDEQLRIFDGDCTDAEGLGVDVVVGVDFERVQVALAGRPQMGGLNSDRPLGSLGAGDLAACGIKHADVDVAGTGRFNTVGEKAVRPRNVRDDGDVGDRMCGTCVEDDGAVNTRVGEEI